ncbi:MAG: Glutamine amidotransferase, class I, partial [uncultured Corynebacteriales bacterium]
ATADRPRRRAHRLHRGRPARRLAARRRAPARPPPRHRPARPGVVLGRRGDGRRHGRVRRRRAPVAARGAGPAAGRGRRRGAHARGVPGRAAARRGARRAGPAGRRGPGDRPRPGRQAGHGRGRPAVRAGAVHPGRAAVALRLGDRAAGRRDAAGVLDPLPAPGVPGRGGRLGHPVPHRDRPGDGPPVGRRRRRPARPRVRLGRAGRARPVGPGAGARRPRGRLAAVRAAVRRAGPSPGVRPPL